MNNTQQEIIAWFEKAVPAPTDANKVMQFAVHIEEFAEMLELEALYIQPNSRIGNITNTRI